MANWVSHIFWGTIAALIPLIFVGLKYLNQPSLAEKVVPYEYFLHILLFGALTNLGLQLLVAPYIRDSSYTSYTNWIVGALAGLILSLYVMNLWEDKLPEKIWNLKKNENLYAVLTVWGSLIYGLFLPYLQRQVCFYGPRGI